MLLAQLVAGSCSPDRSACDDDQVIAQALHDIELMRGEQHRDPARRTFLQHAGDLFDGERVETRERLVEDQHLRIVHEGCRDLRPLLIAE